MLTKNLVRHIVQHTRKPHAWHSQHFNGLEERRGVRYSPPRKDKGLGGNARALLVSRPAIRPLSPPGTTRIAAPCVFGG